MSKPTDETLAERRLLPRLYAHYHQLLVDLLEDLVENTRVLLLAAADKRQLKYQRTAITMTSRGQR